MKRVILICAVLYLVGFGWLVYKAMTTGIYFDRIDEYKEYSEIIQRGGWQPVSDSLINSSVISTLVPAKIYQFTGWDAVAIFKVWPCFFYALVPPFIFLIARRYMRDGLAVTASLFVMSQFLYFHQPNLGRISIALGILAVFAWALISKRYLVLVISGVLLVFSYYATAIIVVFIGAVTLIGLIIQHRTRFREYYKLAIIGVLVVAVIYGWYFMYLNSVGGCITAFLANTKSDLAVSRPAFLPNPTEVLTRNPSAPMDTASMIPVVYNYSEYEPTLQYAFAQRWGVMNYWQKMEWFACWAIILSLIGGIIWALKKGILWGAHLYMAIATFAICIVPIFSPWASVKYGVVRAYMMGLMVLAPFFVYGLASLANRLRWNEYIMPGILIAANFIIVSGVASPYLFGLINL